MFYPFYVKEQLVVDISVRNSQRPLMQRLLLAWQKYEAVFRTSVASNLAYSNEVIFRALLLLVLVFVLSQLWSTTFSTRGATLLSGFTIAQMVWYLIAAESIAMSLPALGQRIDQEVRSGVLAYQLVRPCSYVLYNFAQYLGERLIRFGLNFVIGVLLGLWMVGLPSFSWQGWLAWPLVALLAMSIEFVYLFTIGLLAFWLEETQIFSFIFSRLTLVLGGVLAPLDIFPQPLRQIAQFLPFSAILYGPARTLVHFEPTSFLNVLTLQLAMLLVGSIILFLVYRRAIRYVSINGG
jgi:ABC-2 type transport system permease protein